MFEAVRDCYDDQYGLTWVRDLPEAEVLARLGVDGTASHPRYTVREAKERFGWDTPAVRVGRSESGPSCSTCMRMDGPSSRRCCPGSPPVRR
ncbi:hypothetical protein NKH77_40280 [Streptomyces sp. M19]